MKEKQGGFLNSITCSNSVITSGSSVSYMCPLCVTFLMCVCVCVVFYLQAIYGRLFIWVVDKINAVIHTQPEESEDPRQTIGLLDIFGFENFDKNRLMLLVFPVLMSRCVAGRP